MRFNSLDYVLFLALALMLWWMLARYRVARLVGIVVLSCVFYMAWHPFYVLLLLAPIGFDFLAGIMIGNAKTLREKRSWLAFSLVCNLGLLGLFKYFNFGSLAVAQGLALVGVEIDPPILDVLLPVGISFYTFQTMSYTIDVFRGRIEPCRNILDFAFLVTYFPQLVAGPIVRASELLPQVAREPAVTPEGVGRALFLIGVGLIKKIAIADFLSVNLVDRVFDNPQGYTATEVVIGLYGFTMQIYCDFSGYTDVARGSAKLFGIELPENFDRPYQATSPAEFWRRWHMTLSRWLRDYLYFPLGGSKVGEGRAYFNLGLTMFLIGIWHGAAYTFVFYALLQATAMVLHRYFYKRAGRQRDAVDPLWMQALKIVACLQFVVFSRILFRAESLDNAQEVTMRLFSGTSSTAQVSWSVWLVLLLAFAAHYTPKRWMTALERGFVALPAVAQGVVLFALSLFLATVATSEVVPYIYFQF